MVSGQPMGVNNRGDTDEGAGHKINKDAFSTKPVDNSVDE